jgi:surface polysaccharide O-acyltransferase-like enzyme
MNITRKYIPYGDVARVLGTVAVVVGHVCDMVQYAHDSLTHFWVCNLFNSASRWAVPVYIMLSGALLLDPARIETPEMFYKKRLSRLGVPIVFWTAFFMAFTVWLQNRPEGHRMHEGTNIWTELLLGKPYAHLHFIFRIAGLYAFTPFFRAFLQHASRRVVTLAVILCLGLASLKSLADGITGTEESVFVRFVPFIGYYLAGYLLRDVKLSARALYGCWFLAAGCVFLLAGGTGILIEAFGPALYPSKGYLLYDFLSPVRIALGVTVFMIFVNTFDEEWLHTRPSKFLSKWIAPATLGIYLVHPLFRELLAVAGYNAALGTMYTDSPLILLGIPLMTALVYIPSLVFTLVVMRIPFVQKIVL